MIVKVKDFLPSRNGFPFPNSYPADRKFFLFHSPFGPVEMMDATRGLCGGMVFTAMDLFHHGISEIPQEPTDKVFQYFCRRLFASWGLPFAWFRYWDWQLRSAMPGSIAGVQLRRGVFQMMNEREWPRIKADLDAGQLVSLGLVKQRGFSPKKLGMNHQVLAYGYDLDETSGEVRLSIYDPNYPCNDSIGLIWNLNDDSAAAMVNHDCEGPTVRGIFYSEYRPSAVPPNFAGPVS